MNSYNDNLRSAVVNSLQSQYLNQKKLKSQMTAAMFTLYHAEEAAIIADEKFDKAQSTLILKGGVKAQAVKNSNIAVNLLASATQADQYFKQSVNNTAVCAANVQVAAKSIVRLSGDIANIAGITGAADLDTDIDGLARGVRSLMNDTAKIAELASQFAMEASLLTAEVSSSTVLGKAKSTNNLMNNLLQVASANYDTASQIVAADNVTRALTSGAEKVAEGTLEDVSVDYQASRNAYQSVNQKLNINLRVPHLQNTNSGFTVYFDAIVSAFRFDLLEDISQPRPELSLYPVQDYYLIAVKESKMLTFTISEAENLQVNIGRYSQRITKIPETAKRHLKYVFSYENPENPKESMQDSDGDPINFGDSYVMFVLAIYTDAYKYALNNFDNFLSASSKPFTRTTKLNAATFKSKENPVFTNTSQMEEMQNFWTAQFASNIEAAIPAPKVAADLLADYGQMIEFYASNNPDDNPEYRCIILPVDDDNTDGFLTNHALTALIKNELPALEDLFADLDAKIDDLKKSLPEEELKVGKAIEKVKKDIQIILKDILPIPLYVQKERLLADLIATLKHWNEIDKINEEIQNLLYGETHFMHSLEQTEDGQGFFFNMTLAEQVTSGNYSIAVPAIIGETATKSDDNKAYVVFIGPETTDNFGTPLTFGKKYVAVVLSTSQNAIDNPANYINALTPLTAGCNFTYNPNNQNA